MADGSRLGFRQMAQSSASAMKKKRGQAAQLGGQALDRLRDQRHASEETGGKVEAGGELPHLLGREVARLVKSGVDRGQHQVAEQLHSLLEDLGLDGDALDL